MILHTFQARSTKEALQKARDALGPSACILEVARDDGGMRVVAAAERPGARRPELPDVDGLSEDRQARYSALCEGLLTRGFSPAAASRLAAGALAESADTDEAGRDARLAAAMRRWLKPSRRLSPGERECVALVGPPGAGKTSLIAKRAARLADAGQLVLASADRERLGGAEELEAVARALGARFQIVRHRDDLNALVARCAGRAHLFVDTPGVSWSRPDALPELAALLSSLRRDEIELLVPADLDADAMSESARVFLALSPTRVSVGRADLAFRPGVVLSLLISLGLVVESVSTGPRIPQDLDEEPLAGLARLAFGAGARHAPRPAPAPAAPRVDTSLSSRTHAHKEIHR